MPGLRRVWSGFRQKTSRELQRSAEVRDLESDRTCAASIMVWLASTAAT